MIVRVFNIPKKLDNVNELDLYYDVNVLDIIRCMKREDFTFQHCSKDDISYVMYDFDASLFACVIYKNSYYLVSNDYLRFFNPDCNVNVKYGYIITHNFLSKHIIRELTKFHYNLI